MSRTDEVRGQGKERGGSGGGAPFVRWGDSYAWVEGRVSGSFNTKYGLAVTLDIERVGGEALEGQGRDDEGNDFTVKIEPGIKANIGTQSATLVGKITAEDEGKLFHVAFEGWESPKGGNRYRVFRVVEMEDRVPAGGGQGTWDGPEPEDTRDHSQGDPDDDMPF